MGLFTTQPLAEERVSTHWEDCWKSFAREHHACSIARAEQAEQRVADERRRTLMWLWEHGLVGRKDADACDAALRARPSEGRGQG